MCISSATCQCLENFATGVEGEKEEDDKYDAEDGQDEAPDDQSHRPEQSLDLVGIV